MDLHISRIAIEPTTTYSAATKLCQGGKQLCSRKQLCPSGPLTAPVVAVQPAESWVPVSGRLNSWLSLGSKFANRRLCKLHQESVGGLPTWGQSETPRTFRQVAFCCTATTQNVRNSVIAHRGGLGEDAAVKEGCAAWDSATCDNFVPSCGHAPATGTAISEVDPSAVLGQFGLDRGRRAVRPQCTTNYHALRIGVSSLELEAVSKTIHASGSERIANDRNSVR